MLDHVNGICISSRDITEFNNVKSMILELSPQTKVINFDDILMDVRLLDDCNFIFTIGGDGSVAWLIRTFFDKFQSVEKLKPIVPVTRPESIGYLKQIDLESEKFKQGFQQILDGKYTVQNRTILKTKINEITYLSVNEIFFSSVPHLGKFSVYIKFSSNNRYEPLTSTMADGAMVITSLGSTGWALSYGGQIGINEDSLELVFPGGIHSSAHFTLPRKNIKLVLEEKNSVISPETISAYLAARKQRKLSYDEQAADTLDLVYGARVIIDGKIIGYDVSEIIIQSDTSIPFVFLHQETILDKARKLTKQPSVK